VNGSVLQELDSFAQSKNVPAWLVHALAIEYLDCREYALPPTVWKFNFGRVESSQLGALVRGPAVVFTSPVFHNYKLLPAAITARLVSNVPMPPALDVRDLVPEGPVSSYHVAGIDNPPEVWDPKLNFSTHMQVRDYGKLWQWEVARFVAVPGRQSGRWESDHLDVRALEDVDAKLAVLRNARPRRWSPLARRDFKRRVSEFYADVEGKRAPIRVSAVALHKQLVENFSSPGHIATHEPPLLSHFDQFRVRHSRVHTTFHAEPLFFRACVQHSQRAFQLARETQAEHRRFAVLDELRTEKVSAVIFAVACIEALINSEAARLITGWAAVERSMSIEDKFSRVIATRGEIYDPQVGVDRAFQQLVRLRNGWVHYKRSLRTAVRFDGGWVTAEDAELSDQFITELPRSVREIAGRLAGAGARPKWLDPAPGWNV